MKSQKVTYCTAEHENINIFSVSLAALSKQGEAIIAQHTGTLVYIPPKTSEYEIQRLFEQAEYNPSMRPMNTKL